MGAVPALSFPEEEGGWHTELCFGALLSLQSSELSSAESWDCWCLELSLEEGLWSGLTSQGSRGENHGPEAAGFNSCLLTWW